jgi:Periplasmic copper-binding protein (NosD)
VSHRSSVLRNAVSLVVTSAVWLCTQTEAQQYTLTDLGAFGPTAIAGSYVVGAENDLPVRLNLDTGEKVTLQDPWGRGGIASAVLPSGVAVGSVITPQGHSIATFWDVTGQAFLLPGGLPSHANGINEQWVIAGNSACAAGEQATRWRPWATEAECLGTTRSYSGGVDSQGRVWAEEWNFANPDGHPMDLLVWDEAGRMTNLGTPPTGYRAPVMDVHPDGIAVGWDHWMATLGTGFTMLAMPSNASDCLVSGVNRARQAVGPCRGRAGTSAYLWTTPTTVWRLQDLILPNTGLALENASDISDAGEIVGRTHDDRGVLLTPIPAQMATCGGSVPCQCGDTVVRDYTFTAHLGPCEVQGTDAALIIASGVKVNGNSFWLYGTGDGTGVLFDGTQGAQLGGLHVTNFANGVKMRGGASGNFYHSGWSWNHRQHGVWLEQAGSGNYVWGVYSLLNGEGITLEQTQGNTIAYSTAWSNPVSLHLRRADRNLVWASNFYGDQGHAASIQDSHGNSFYLNTFVCGGSGAILLQDSDDNTAEQNVIQCPVRSGQAVASTR